MVGGCITRGPSPAKQAKDNAGLPLPMPSDYDVDQWLSSPSKEEPPPASQKARGKLEIALPQIWMTQVIPLPPFCIRRWLSPDW